MHLTWRQTLAMLVAVGALLGPLQVSAGILPSPLVVTMSGTLQPFNGLCQLIRTAPSLDQAR